MSFADVSSRSAVPPPSGRDGHNEDPTKELAGRIFQMTTKVSAFKRLVEQIGTKRDTHDLRRRIQERGEEMKGLAKSISGDLKAGGGERGRAAHERLLKDFQAALGELQRAQRMAVEREGAFLPKEEAEKEMTTFAPGRGGGGGGYGGDAEADDAEAEGQHLLAASRQQEFLQLEDEVDHNAALIRERDAGIRDIQGQIGDVNEIFQDLAVLVNEQGGMLDDIESNIVSAAERTKEGLGELVRAETSQRGTTNKSCFILVIFTIALVIITVVLAA